MAYCMQCKSELGVDNKRHADVCMHMQIVYTYINRFLSICLESGRAASMHLMGLGPTAVAGGAFEAAVKDTQAVAPSTALSSAVPGGGCSASDWGARQIQRHAMGVAMAGARARGGSSLGPGARGPQLPDLHLARPHVAPWHQ